MSTKTSIKRIALVAAAALALGGFSAVSASAASNTYIFAKVADGITSGTAADITANGVAGPVNFVTLGFTTNATAGVIAISGAGATAVAAGTTTGIVVNTAGTQITKDAADRSAALLNVFTPTVGTITVNYYKLVSAGVYASTPTESVVITVNAAASSGVFSAAKSTVYLASGETSVAVAADAAVTVAATANWETAVATIQVNLKDTLGAGYKDTLTATITSGPGVLLASNDSTTVGGANNTGFKISTPSSPKYSVSAASYDTTYTDELRSVYFGIFANGQVGTSVVSIKNTAGTVLATKSIVFAGTTPATMKVAVKKSYVSSSSTSATSKVIAVNLYDVGGNEITGTQSITGAVATGSLVGGAVSCGSYDATDLVYYCSVVASSTQQAATTDGKETYTLTAGTVTGTAVVNFVSAVATAITIAGPATADPGSKVTYTLTATGANGAALPDGAYTAGAILTAANPTANASLTAQPFGATETITLVAGVATSYTYAPYGGTLSLSWKVAGTASTLRAGSDAAPTTGDYATSGIAKALAATVVTAEDVTIAGNTEATAAANAATDAANQAADAADNATQAAAEALAAVNTLATTVATLIAGIKSQIASLNKLIVAIKNKLKA